MNGGRVYSLERRLAKIEKDRGVTDADDFFNQTLLQLGEPPRASESEAFLRLLRLMQAARLERAPAPRPSATPPSAQLNPLCD